MNRYPFRIAVAGTHSTGKTTFLTELKHRFEQSGVSAAYVHDSAVNAREKGFPILADHTFESTAWLMARAIELETEASLSADVILVDRPVADALGYLRAALIHTSRSVTNARICALEKICEAWAPEYDLVFLTVLDPLIELGEGRDDDAIFRTRAADEVTHVVDKFMSDRHLLRHGETDAALAFAIAEFESNRS
ncbi:AAA family ATPase [Qipengyuania sp. DGS5-3]|uniref:AAA family ATPase n=1 Tax=Qipengyuania sp. DGS5-3 TaxID=3349632 RepID=UPI0036D23B6F